MKQRLTQIAISQDLSQNQEALNYIFANKPSFGPFYSIVIDTSLNMENLKRVFDSLDKTNSVREIKLCNNSMHNDWLLYEKMKMINKLFKVNKHIESIDFSGNRMSDGHIKKLSQIISSTKSLKYINLSDTNIRNEGAKILSKKIYGKGIIELDLSYNNIKAAGLEDIIGRINVEGNNIESLNISGNYMGNKLVSKLIPLVRHAKSLKIINLSHNNMSDSGLESFYPYVLSSKNLSSVSLSNNNFGDRGCEFICEIIKNNRSLIELDITRAFPHISSDQYLDLKISNALGMNPDITSIGLSPFHYSNIMVELNIHNLESAKKSLIIKGEILQISQYKSLLIHNKSGLLTDLFNDYMQENGGGYSICAINISALMFEAIENLREIGNFLIKNNICHYGKSQIPKSINQPWKKIKTPPAPKLTHEFILEKCDFYIKDQIFSYLDMDDFTSICKATYGLLYHASKYTDRLKHQNHHMFGRKDMLRELNIWFVNYYQPNIADSDDDNINALVLFNCIRSEKKLINMQKLCIENTKNSQTLSKALAQENMEWECTPLLGLSEPKNSYEQSLGGDSLDHISQIETSW
ncbi:MAG: hypothetical protein SFT91_05135 [Rickettsiaceae bacterium]|nr:hypothetical protein [Rickettsiaceae bacterium]